jgi:O-antigen/teichoic acid export membrane protein
VEPIIRSRKTIAVVNTAFSFAMLAVSVFTAFVFMPLYLSYVGPERYGAWLATGNVLAWLAAVDPGIGDLARQRVAEQLGATIGTGLAVIVVLAMGIAWAGCIWAKGFIGLLLLDAAVSQTIANAFVIASFGAGLALVGNYLSGVVQGLQASYSVGCIGLCAAIAVPVVRLAMLAGGFGLDSFAWAVLAQAMILLLGGLLVLIIRLRELHVGFSCSGETLRSMAGLSLFTGLNRLAGTIANNMLAFLLTRYLGPSAAVVYEVTRQPIEIARTFIDKPASAFLPSFAHLKGTSQTEKIAFYSVRYMRFLVWVLGLAVAGFAMLNSRFVSLWVGGNYYAGMLTNILLVAVMAAAAIGNSARLLLFAFGRIQLTGVVVICDTLIMLLASYAGVRLFGMPGLAAAPLISFLCVGLWFLPRVLFREYIGVEETREFFVRTVLPALCSSLMTAIIASVLLWAVVDVPSWPTFFVISLTAAVAYVLLLGVLSPLFREECGSLFRAAAMKRAISRKADVNA